MPVAFNREIAAQIGDRYIDGLRIDFDITKTIKSSPLNKATISIYNVSEELFEHVVEQRREIAIQLFAGHSGALGALGQTAPPNRLFIGNPVKNGVEFVWSGADRILRIDAQDGYKAYQKGRLALSLDASELTLQELVAEAAGSLGLPIGIVDVPGDVRLTQGAVLTGPTSVVLDRLAASTGAEWSIQDGALQFIPRRKARRTRGPLYSRAARNIMEYPKLTEEGLKIKVVLDPSILPGDRFKVETGNKRYDGIYRATTVKHTGSKWENTFQTEITAKAWNGEVAAKNGSLQAKLKAEEAKTNPALYEPDENGITWWSTE